MLLRRLKGDFSFTETFTRFKVHLFGIQRHFFCYLIVFQILDEELLWPFVWSEVGPGTDPSHIADLQIE